MGVLTTVLLMLVTTAVTFALEGPWSVNGTQFASLGDGAVGGTAMEVNATNQINCVIKCAMHDGCSAAVVKQEVEGGWTGCTFITGPYGALTPKSPSVFLEISYVLQ